MKLKLDDVLFFLLRHGETAGNKLNIYRSWSNAPQAQLDPEGRKAAIEAGEFLAMIKAPVELIICDTLDRVVETCEIVALDFPKAQLQLVRALHPLHMGEFTLKSKDENPVEPFLKDPGRRIPGGESVAEFDIRQTKIFDAIWNLSDDFPAGRILVGGHGSNVSYLANHRFGNPGKHVGYEGLVHPGGLIAVTKTGLYPLTRVREGKSKEQEHPKPLYPADHKPAMRVPVGGSSCVNCEYLGPDQKSCMNKFFIRWNGSNQLPAPAPEFCSDWYEPKEGADAGSKVGA